MDEVKLDDNCIKTGRGPSTYNHPGNLRFRSMILKHLHSYDTSTKAAKTFIVDALHQEMREIGLKFVHKENGLWKEVDNEKSRKKIAHRFRDARDTERRIKLQATRNQQAFGLDAAASVRSFSSNSSAATHDTDKSHPQVAQLAQRINGGDRQNVNLVPKEVSLVPEQYPIDGDNLLRLLDGTDIHPGEDAVNVSDTGGGGSDGAVGSPRLDHDRLATSMDTADSFAQQLRSFEEEGASQHYDDLSMGMLPDTDVGKLEMSSIFAEVTELLRTTSDDHHSKDSSNSQ